MLCLKQNVQQRNISFKKDTEIEKAMLLQVKGFIQIIVKFRTEKNQKIILRDLQNNLHKNYCVPII